MMESMERDELAEIDVTSSEFDAMLEESEPAEVTGPPAGARRIRFEIVGDALHAYRWRLVAPSGMILADSAITYRSPADVLHALSLLAAAIKDAPVVDLNDAEQRKAS